MAVVVVEGMIVYTTQDAYVAFVAGRITREEFFEVCTRGAEREQANRPSLVCRDLRRQRPLLRLLAKPAQM